MGEDTHTFDHCVLAASKQAHGLADLTFDQLKKISIVAEEQLHIVLTICLEMPNIIELFSLAYSSFFVLSGNICYFLSKFIFCLAVSVFFALFKVFCLG